MKTAQTHASRLLARNGKRRSLAVSRNIAAPILFFFLASPFALSAADPANFAHRATDEKVEILWGSNSLTTLVLNEPQTLRPYYTALRIPAGPELTRPHPPRPNIDPTDHPTMHPGLWLAFGDLGGVDFWRNKGRVAAVVKGIAPEGQGLTIRLVNRYLDGERELAVEQATHHWQHVPAGWLCRLSSTFTATEPTWFGDQEEMGLGIRIATPLSVLGGAGEIRNSRGGINEKVVWGQLAEWCDYSGVIDGKRYGLAIFPHPDNFRPSWFHARDYGLLVANPFGRKAFTQLEASRVELATGKSLTLQFGVLLHQSANDERIDMNAMRMVYLAR